MIWHFLEVWALILAAFAAGCVLGTLLYMALAASPMARMQVAAAEAVGGTLGGLRGRAGMSRVGEFATLNSNYLMTRLRQMGYTAAYPERRASHEFILTLKPQLQQHGVSAMDVAKRLLDFGFHAPTTYFPLLVPECLLIEPTETESKETLDAFVGAMSEVLREAASEPETLRTAPHRMPVRRLDDVRAARELDLAYRPAP